MSHNPSAKRNRQFRSSETRGRRVVRLRPRAFLAAAVTSLHSAPTANAGTTDLVANTVGGPALFGPIVDALPLGGSSSCPGYRRAPSKGGATAGPGPRWLVATAGPAATVGQAGRPAPAASPVRPGARPRRSTRPARPARQIRPADAGNKFGGNLFHALWRLDFLPMSLNANSRQKPHLSDILTACLIQLPLSLPSQIAQTRAGGSRRAGTRWHPWPLPSSR